MGVVSSMCKRKKRGKFNNTYLQPTTSLSRRSPTTTSWKTYCSALSREPTSPASFRYHHYLPQQQNMYSASTKQSRGHPSYPILSSSFYDPPTDDSTYHSQSNPYVAHAYSQMAPPSIHETDRPRITINKSTSNPSLTTSTSDIVHDIPCDEHRAPSTHRSLTRVASTWAMNSNEQQSKATVNDGSRLIKRSVSMPIDMFLIDISNEHVVVGQPVSMNIRHLLLDTLENHRTNSSSSVRIEPLSTTTYAHENLLSYIPYVCERYPNAIVDSDRLTRNTLHVRVPSQFSRSLNVLS